MNAATRPPRGAHADETAALSFAGTSRPSARGRSAFLLLAGMALASATLAVRHATALRAAWPRDVDALYLPSANTLRVLSLGHSEMAADLVAARANVYFGSQVISKGDFAFLKRYLETAAALDPGFHRLYLRGAAMLVYTGQAFSVDAFLAANHLLEKGERAFPQDWELPFQRGFNLLFELPRVAGEDDARVPGWRQQGAEALREAALLDGGPPWLPSLAARMLTERGGQELALRHLQQAFAVTDNPETRRSIAAELAKLERAHAAATLAAEQDKLDSLKAAYPYAPEAFALIVGPRARPLLPFVPGYRERPPERDEPAAPGTAPSPDSLSPPPSSSAPSP